MYAEDFSIHNVPFGIGSCASHPKRSVVTRFEDSVVFLVKLVEDGLLSQLSDEVRKAIFEPTVNAFAALPKVEQTATREAIQKLLSQGLSALPSSAYEPVDSVTLHLPLAIGDFTDFSCSRDHVLNASQAITTRRELPPGFEHFPVGYTGRTSSIVVSGTGIRRPKGQYREGEKVVFRPTERLDYELEVAMVIGKGTRLGERVGIDRAEEHIFGLVLLCDWSARDIQALEMNPLGPMNGKSFGTSISPWIITLDALAAFRAPSPGKTPGVPVASYLDDSNALSMYDIDLCATLETPSSSHKICQVKFSTLYWSLRDLIAHQTVNGCNLRTGDLLATGTVSGSTADSHGCLLEMVREGGVSIKAEDGQVGKKLWLDDGDVIRISGVAGRGVGFGDCFGEILPAN